MPFLRASRSHPSATIFPIVTAMCLLFVGTGWSQEVNRSVLGTEVKFEQTSDDPKPFFKIIRETGEETIIDALGAHPLGKLPVAIYKAADFARQVGVAATEREDASRSATMVLVNADAALLKGMIAQGIDTNSDPRAIAAKNRLRDKMLDLNTNDQGTLTHLGSVVWKHLPYAVATVAANKAIKKGIGKAVQWGSPAIDEALPIGDEVRFMMGNRSGLASGLRYLGWRKLGARADLAKKYTDELVHKLIQISLDEMVKVQLKQTFGDALDNLYREVLEDHPSQIRYTVISQPQLYAPLVIPALVALPMPAPVAARAVAAPVAAAPVVVQTSTDRVANTIYVEDSYMRRSRSYERSSPSTSSSPPPPPPPPEEKRQPTKWEIELHHELMCAGAGNKPGCGNWDGKRGGTLTSR